MSSIPAQFANVTVVTKANVYFDGNVVSHTVLCADGSKKTLGLIRHGQYHFNTAAAERMQIVESSSGSLANRIVGLALRRRIGPGLAAHRAVRCTILGQSLQEPA